MQAYSDPERESDPHALPDLEIFYQQVERGMAGWYYWFCFPGCMPNGEPEGPFSTPNEALLDARRGME